MGSSRSLCHRRGPAKRIRRDFIRDPALLEFLGLPNAGLIQENELEQALIDQLQGFLLAFDLKRGVLTHQDVGQMDMYVRMYDELKRGPEDSPTVGLILCAQKDESVVRYSVRQRATVRQYLQTGAAERGGTSHRTGSGMGGA